MNFVLCGMMGAGKTTVAKELARVTGLRLVDTDELITAEYGKISEIFAVHGEAFFRSLERRVAALLSEADGLIISTGGGFILNEENAALMRKNGAIVYLRATRETLLSRLKKDGERPLLEGEESLEEKIDRLLKARSTAYEAASTLAVDVDGKTPEKIAIEIKKATENRSV